MTISEKQKQLLWIFWSTNIQQNKAKVLHPKCPYTNELRAISSAFCSEGSPPVSWNFFNLSALICSVGFPLNSVNFSASPSFVPTSPICEMGFWSKNSAMKASRYVNVSDNREGRRSFSCMAFERSMIMNKCRMIPRWIGSVSRNSLLEVEKLKTCAIG